MMRKRNGKNNRRKRKKNRNKRRLGTRVQWLWLVRLVVVMMLPPGISTYDNCNNSCPGIPLHVTPDPGTHVHIAVADVALFSKKRTV